MDSLVEDLYWETEKGSGQSDGPNSGQSEEERGHEYNQSQVEPI